MANVSGEKNLGIISGVAAVAVGSGALGYEAGLDLGDSSASAHDKAITTVANYTMALDKLKAEPSSPQSLTAIRSGEAALRTEIRQTPIPSNEQPTYSYIGAGIGSGVVMLSVLSTFIKSRRLAKK